MILGTFAPRSPPSSVGPPHERFLPRSWSLRSWSLETHLFPSPSRLSFRNLYARPLRTGTKSCVPLPFWLCIETEASRLRLRCLVPLRMRTGCYHLTVCVRRLCADADASQWQWQILIIIIVYNNNNVTIVLVANGPVRLRPRPAASRGGLVCAPEGGAALRAEPYYYHCYDYYYD